MYWFVTELVVAAVLLAVSFTVSPTGQAAFDALIRKVLRGFAVVFGVYAFASTSYVIVGGDQVALLDRVFGGSKIREGAYLAVPGENGPQTQVVGPGFHAWPLVNITYNVTKVNVVEVPQGKVGLLNARDGSPLRPEQTLADPLHAFMERGTGKNVDLGRMISDAAYFMANGGQKGPQTTVLTPGKYRLNTYLWEITLADVLTIPTGFVGVIKSNIHGAVDLGDVLRIGKPEKCDPIHIGDPKKLVAPLVPRGCVGVWNFALPPGQYNLNWSNATRVFKKDDKDQSLPHAYEVTLVDTRQQAWLYHGGYKRREIQLEVDQQEGKIVQKEIQSDIPVTPDAADAAIAVKVEGWITRQAVRALVQTTPENAPFVVASVGGLREVENRVVTPALQSLLTDIAGGSIRLPDPQDPTKSITRPTHALDFIEARVHIERMLEERIIVEAGKAGVLMQEVRLLDTDFPPELLVARKREQLAEQLAKAFREEMKAQQSRVTVARERAIADQQPELIKAQIAQQAANLLAEAQIAQGRGERGRLQEAAVGQKAQMEVLGADKVMMLQVIAQLLSFAEKNPKVLEAALTNAHKFVPTTQVGASSGFDLTALAAMVLGMQGQTVPTSAPSVPALQAKK